MTRRQTDRQTATDQNKGWSQLQVNWRHIYWWVSKRFGELGGFSMLWYPNT